MPCRSDYMKPNKKELESKLVAQLIAHVASIKRSIEVPEYVKEALRSNYGSPLKIDDMTRLLCSAIRGMTPEEEENIVWNGRDKWARKLADWWEKHEALDTERRRLEELAKREEAMRLVQEERRKRAIVKIKEVLTPEELQALGISQ